MSVNPLRQMRLHSWIDASNGFWLGFWLWFIGDSFLRLSPSEFLFGQYSWINSVKPRRSRVRSHRSECRVMHTVLSHIHDHKTIICYYKLNVISRSHRYCGSCKCSRFYESIWKQQVPLVGLPVGCSDWMLPTRFLALRHPEGTRSLGRICPLLALCKNAHPTNLINIHTWALDIRNKRQCAMSIPILEWHV